MSAEATSPIPPGMHTVTPHLICAEAARAIDFYKEAFGATEVTRLPGANGKLMHAMIKIGDSSIMLAEEMPQWSSFGPLSLKGTPVVIHLYVNDVDAFAKQAIAAGAKVTMPITDMFWGDRYGQLEDPFGHRWSVATHIRSVSREEMEVAVQSMAGAKADCPEAAHP